MHECGCAAQPSRALYNVRTRPRYAPVASTWKAARTVVGAGVLVHVLQERLERHSYGGVCAYRPNRPNLLHQTSTDRSRLRLAVLLRKMPVGAHQRLVHAEPRHPDCQQNNCGYNSSFAQSNAAPMTYANRRKAVAPTQVGVRQCG